MDTKKTAYERDFYAWANHQALLLRQKKFDEVDIENLIEEVEDLGKSQERSLKSALKQLILHLLKLQFQPEKNGMNWQDPHREKNSSWERSVDNQRSEINELLDETPSLVRVFKDEKWIQSAWNLGVSLAYAETTLPKSTFPKTPIWTIEQILDDDFYPTSQG